MGQPCCVTSFCFDPANPLENLSSERPDQELYLGYNSGWGGFEPPINGSWGTLGCVSFCQSTISQQDADNCAANQQIACTVNKCNDASCGGNGGGGGWQNQDGNQVQLFSNGPAACTILCPDGLPFVFRVPAGSIQAPNQAAANLVAQSIACIEGQSERMCMNNIDPGTCAGDFYADVIETEGGTVPIIYTLISGNLPPGFSLVQSDEFSVDVSGTCSTPGNYTFTIRAVDRFGIFMIKTYTIAIIGITNSPSQATPGTAYSFSFTVAGGTGPYTFTIVAGSLPQGLTMDSAGNITGTPTTGGSSSFTMQVVDSNGATCDVAETLTVQQTCDCTITDWVANPGTCRLRLTAASYHDGILLPCAGATPSGLPPWDGTLPVFSGGQYLSATNAPTTVSVSGHKFFGANLVFAGGHWSFGISGDSGGIGNGMWIGPNTSLCPIGNYTFQLGCQVQPVLTLTLEAYTP